MIFYEKFKNLIGGHMFETPTVLIHEDLIKYHYRIVNANKNLRLKKIKKQFVSKLPASYVRDFIEVKYLKELEDFKYNYINLLKYYSKYDKRGRLIDKSSDRGYKFNHGLRVSTHLYNSCKGPFFVINLRSQGDLDSLKVYYPGNDFYKLNDYYRLIQLRKHSMNKLTSFYKNFKKKLKFRPYKRMIFNNRLRRIKETMFTFNKRIATKNFKSRELPYFNICFSFIGNFLHRKLGDFIVTGKHLIPYKHNYTLNKSFFNEIRKYYLIKYKNKLNNIIFKRYFVFKMLPLRPFFLNKSSSNKFFTNSSENLKNLFNMKFYDINNLFKFLLTSKLKTRLSKLFESLVFSKRSRFSTIFTRTYQEDEPSVKKWRILKTETFEYVENPMLSEKEINLRPVRLNFYEFFKSYNLGYISFLDRWLLYVILIKNYLTSKAVLKVSIKNNEISDNINNIKDYDITKINSEKFNEFNLNFNKPFSKNVYMKSFEFNSTIRIFLESTSTFTAFINNDEELLEYKLILESYKRKLSDSELNYSQKFLKYVFKKAFNKDKCFYEQGLTSDSINFYQVYLTKKALKRKKLFEGRKKVSFLKFKFKFYETFDSIKDFMKIPFKSILLIFNEDFLRMAIIHYNHNISDIKRYYELSINWLWNYFVWYLVILKKLITYRYLYKIYSEIRLFFYIFFTGYELMPTRGVLKSLFGLITYFDFLVCTIETLVWFYWLRFLVFFDEFSWWIAPHVQFWLFNFWLFRNYFLYEILYALWYVVSLFFIFDYLYHRVLYNRYYLVTYRNIYIDANYYWTCFFGDKRSIEFAKYVQFNHERLVTFQRWLKWVHIGRPRIFYRKFMLLLLNFLLYIIKNYIFPTVYTLTAILLDEINSFSLILSKVVIFTNKLDDISWLIYEKLSLLFYIKYDSLIIYHWHCYTLEYKGFLKALVYTPLYIIIIILQIFFIIVNVIILLLPLIFVLLETLLEGYYNYIAELLKVSPYASSKEHFEKYYAPRLFNNLRAHEGLFHNAITSSTHIEPISPKDLAHKENYLTYYDKRSNRMCYNMSTVNNIKVGYLRELQFLRIRYVNQAFKLNKAFIGKKNNFNLEESWLISKNLPYYVYVLTKPSLLWPNSQFHPKMFGEYGSKFGLDVRSNPLELPNRFSHYYFITSRPSTSRTIYDFLPNYWFDKEIDDMIEDEFESSTMDLFDTTKPHQSKYINLKDRHTVHESSYTDLELHEETTWAEITHNIYNKSLDNFLVRRENLDGLQPDRIYEYYNEDNREDEAKYVRYRLPEYADWMYDIEAIETTYDTYQEFFKEHEIFEKKWIHMKSIINTKYQITDKLNKDIKENLKIKNEIKVQLNHLKLKKYKPELYEMAGELIDSHFRTIHYEENKFFFKTAQDALKILEKTYKLNISLSSEEDLKNLLHLVLKKLNELRLQLKDNLNDILNEIILLQSNYLEKIKPMQQNNFINMNLGKYKPIFVTMFNYFFDENMSELKVQLDLVKEQINALDFDIKFDNIYFKYEPLLKNVERIVFIKEKNLFKTKEQSEEAFTLLKELVAMIKKDKAYLIKQYNKIKKTITTNQSLRNKFCLQHEGFNYYHTIYEAHLEGGFSYPIGEYGLYIYESFIDWYLEYTFSLQYFSFVMPDGEYYEHEEDEDDEDEEDDEEDWYDETDGHDLDWFEDGCDMEEQVEREDLLGNWHDYVFETAVDKGGFRRFKGKDFFSRELCATDLISFISLITKGTKALKTKDKDKLNEFEKKILTGYFLKDSGDIDIEKALIYMRIRHRNYIKRLKKRYTKAKRSSLFSELKRTDKIYIPKGYRDREAEKAKYKEEMLDIQKQYEILAQRGREMKKKFRFAASNYNRQVDPYYIYFKEFFESELGFLFRLRKKKLRYVDYHRLRPLLAFLLKTRKRYPNDPQKVEEVLNDILEKKKEALRRGYVYKLQEEIDIDIPSDIEEIKKEQEFVRDRDSGKFLF